MHRSASLLAQQITLKKPQISLLEAFKEIKKQTDYNFLWAARNVQNTLKVTVNVQAQSVEQTVAELLKGLPLQFKIEDNTIMVFEKKEQDPVKQTNNAVRGGGNLKGIVNSQPISLQKSITGLVTHYATGEPLKGVTVSAKGKGIQVSTGENGFFTLQDVPSAAPITLQFRSVGMKPLELLLDKENMVRVTMEEEVETIKEAVVTGIFQRKKESFTGSSATYTSKELKLIGNQNVLQSLKTLDPAFQIIDNNIFGSDPNRLPDIEINGKSSVIGLSSEYGANPNQPLFILDGFESTLSVISNLSMERIETITLLKDAAAAAIYGSKAANGVVVVETKRPIPGKLKIDYTFRGAVAFPDLSDYNLMNSSEKLEFERMAGVYGTFDHTSQASGGNSNLELLYYNRLRGIASGVDTYWLAEPLRVGFNQQHDITAQGGDANLRYLMSVSYNNIQGIMKRSNRRITNGVAKLTYRKGKLAFSNALSIDVVQADREPVAFSKFALAAPYLRKRNADGSINKLVNANTNGIVGEIFLHFNPLYDYANANSNVEGNNGFTNNFNIIYDMMPGMQLTYKLGLRKNNIHQEIFRSPFNTEFYDATVEKQGKYTQRDGNTFNYDTDLMLSYVKQFKETSTWNIIGGARLDQQNTFNSGYDVFGFIDEEYTNPAFALGFVPGTTATYLDSKRRGASFYGQTNFNLDKRFLFDASLRWDGSSVYGSAKKFTTIWSAGFGWNLQNERYLPFMEMEWLDLLKLRASIGNPGNQNFNDYISMRMYGYNITDRNIFGPGVIVNGGGNPNLRWQKSLNRNVGVEILAFNKRLRLDADYVNKLTDPLLVYIDIPTSTGIGRMPQNMGKQITKGFTLSTNVAAIQKQDFLWRLSLTASQLTAVYRGLGNALENINTANKTRNLVRYYDNASPNDLWAVRSLGIDPATGREVFLNKNNQQTFVHSYEDEVVVGNTEAKIQGVIGTTFMYKGFSASASLRYRYGGQAFLQTLYDKVENITFSTVNYNLDRRAYYDRWKQPGDQVQFKAIGIDGNTPMSSRFVKNDNQLIGESFSLGYETSNKAWLGRLGLATLSARAYMNNIFYASSILNERGLDYPFEQSVSFSINLGFK